MKRAKSRSVDGEPTWLAKARELGNVVTAEGPKRLAPVDVEEPMPEAAKLLERGVRVELALAHDAEVPPAVRERAARTLIELGTRGQVGGTDAAKLTDAEIDARLAQIRERLQLAASSEDTSGAEAKEGEGKP